MVDQVPAARTELGEFFNPLSPCGIGLMVSISCAHGCYPVLGLHPLVLGDVRQDNLSL